MYCIARAGSDRNRFFFRTALGSHFSCTPYCTKQSRVIGNFVGIELIRVQGISKECCYWLKTTNFTTGILCF